MSAIGGKADIEQTNCLGDADTLAASVQVGDLSLFTLQYFRDRLRPLAQNAEALINRTMSGPRSRPHPPTPDEVGAAIFRNPVSHSVQRRFPPP
jgi:hypothetical protein